MFCVCFTYGDQKPDSENTKHINPGSQHAKHFYYSSEHAKHFSPAGNMQSIPIPPRNMGSISILNLNIHDTISTPVRNIQAFSPQPVTYQAFPSKHGNAYPPLVRNMQNMCINLQIFLRFSRIKVYDHSFQRMQKQINLSNRYANILMQFQVCPYHVSSPRVFMFVLIPCFILFPSFPFPLCYQLLSFYLVYFHSQLKIYLSINLKTFIWLCFPLIFVNKIRFLNKLVSTYAFSTTMLTYALDLQYMQWVLLSKI